MDFENGDQVPQTPRLDDDYEPTTPRGSESEVEMDMGMVELLKTCSGDEEIRKTTQSDSDEIMKIVRDLGGSQKAYRKERAKAMKGIVSEIYSPPRVTRAIKMMPSSEVIAGFALDLTTSDVDGRAWNFDEKEMRDRARKKFHEEKPMFLIGSPYCTPYSPLQALSAARRDPEEVRRELVKANVHMEFVAELYREQVLAGRYFLHEHPLCATSWKLECILDVMAMQGVDSEWCDQCQYGQEAGTGHPVRKPTRWMSNSPEILNMLKNKCSGRTNACSRPGGGSHASCTGKTARMAAIYPVKLCKAILQGCRAQLREDGRVFIGFVGIGPKESDAWSEKKLEAKTEKLLNVQVNKAGEEEYKDSVTGQPLNPTLVKEARRKEMEYFDSMKVWMRKNRSDAFRDMGKAPISVRWVDVNKGDDENPNYRSRLVAREIRRFGEEPIFAPTPPLESLRTILSLAATNLPGRRVHIRDPISEKRTQISFIDIKRAYLCAKTDPDDPTYVDLPKEHPWSKDAESCALCLKHMYGTRKAGDGWHEEISGTLVNKLGFSKGDASACIFRHPERAIECSIHGDHLSAAGPKDSLDWYKTELQKHYELEEGARLGPGPKDTKESKMLNRIVRWTPVGLEYEADPRQAEQLIRDMGMSWSKPVGTPGVKVTSEQLAEDRDLSHQRQRPYRGVAARANYLSADRPDMQHAAKEVCRWMSTPTETALLALKRVGRYLESHTRLVYRYDSKEAT